MCNILSIYKGAFNTRVLLFKGAKAFCMMILYKGAYTREQKIQGCFNYKGALLNKIGNSVMYKKVNGIIEIFVPVLRLFY